jgi:hypothetical protein
MNLRLHFLVLVSCLVLLSCGSFSGNIAFRSDSPKDVWVQRVEGFSYPPPVGILTGGHSAHSRLGRMRMPEEVIIYWSHQWHKSDQTSRVSLTGVRRPTGDEELLFVFRDGAGWGASVSAE